MYAIRSYAPPPSGTPRQHAVPAPVTDSIDDTLSALVNLGYKEKDARKVLESMKIPPGAPLEVILKGALKVLVK